MASAVDMEQRFPLRSITFLGRVVPILGQNEFGPCALLSIVNALLLQNALSVSPDLGSVSLAEVIGLVGDQILERHGSRATAGDEAALALRTAVDEAIASLPTLALGLDVNVRFAGPALFEFTSCLGIFDLFDLSLVHGWRVDPVEEAAAARALGDRSYNEVVERVVVGGDDDTKDDEAAGEAAAMSAFLDATATQLTYHGLVELHERLREREIAVLYRNLHFSTVFKLDGVLYVLVTDVGYQHEASIVWEKLDGIDGDTDFVGADFRVAAPKATLEPSARGDVGGGGDGDDRAADPDYLFALQLQHDSDEAVARALVEPASSAPPGGERRRPPPRRLDPLVGPREPAAPPPTRGGHAPRANDDDDDDDDDADLAAALQLSLQPSSAAAAADRRAPAATAADALPVAAAVEVDPPGAKHDDQEDADYRAALTLQFEDDRLDDSALARQLQNEENRRAAQAPPSLPPPPPAPAPAPPPAVSRPLAKKKSGKSSSSCTVS